MIPPCLAPRPVSRPTPGDTHAMCSGRGAVSLCDDELHAAGPPLEMFLAMLDTIGFTRGVLVQGSAHGRDNSAMSTR